MLQKVSAKLHLDLLRPWLISLGVLFFFILLTLILRSYPQMSQKFWLALLLFGGFFVFWMIFFSQFVLPLRTLRERVLAFRRLVGYLLGSHGAAIIVKNGKIEGRKSELTRRGPGVILLDAASAAVLRTPTRITRTVGPGVTFTAGNETVAGVVDLHIQKQSIGPLESEDPFAPIGTSELLPQFEVRKKHRAETRAITRDGIEIVPKISVTFKIDATMCEGGSEFGFRASSVEAAVVGRTIDVNIPLDSPERLHNWQWLPPYLAADVWRELVSKFQMTNFFQPIDGKPAAFTLIQKIVQSRLCEAQADEIDEFGHLTGRKTPSREYALLAKRGIKALKVRISDLRFEEKVEEQLVSNWTSSWLSRAKQERSAIELEKKKVAESGRNAGLWQYAEGISKSVINTPAAEVLSGCSILRQMILGAKGLLLSDSILRENPRDELKSLDELLEWLERGPLPPLGTSTGPAQPVTPPAGSPPPDNPLLGSHPDGGSTQ